MLSNLPSILAPAHRLRKIKGAVPVYPTISRGNKNNGQIEIENEASEDEEALQDIERYGKIYKVTDKDVKLDFLSKYAISLFTVNGTRTNNFKGQGEWAKPFHPVVSAERDLDSAENFTTQYCRTTGRSQPGNSRLSGPFNR